jgi:hypothetical protein
VLVWFGQQRLWSWPVGGRNALKIRVEESCGGPATGGEVWETREALAVVGRRILGQRKLHAPRFTLRQPGRDVLLELIN